MEKKTKPVIKEVIKKCSCEAQIPHLTDLINELIVRVEYLENKINVVEPQPIKSINKVEHYNGEVEPEQKVDSAIRMKYDDKIQSMKNAIAILPPNLIGEDGRQQRENIQAICGFMVDQQMMDEAYEGVKIEP